jgi:Flp pilus assembly protein TadB
MFHLSGCWTRREPKLTQGNRSPPNASDYRMLRDSLFLLIFFVLLIIWLVSWLAFHVAGGLIHLLLVIAIIALVIHLLRGRGRSA